MGEAWLWGFLEEAGGVGAPGHPVSAPMPSSLLQGRAGDMHACVVLSQRKSMPGTGPVFKGNE